ncbi:DNA topoisomerase III [Tissierella creatinini]|nr:DNA topoisomerase III [Tissierella creatinini]TJX67370.1 DNA topoisomerase III [Soehngenia saccharolytica]
MKKLVLAEKPSVARDIARVLNCSKNGNGFIEGEKYIVTWALGHLVTLADPEEYSEKYKTWSMEDLPMLPDQMKLVIIRQSGKQYNAVKTQLHRKDVNEIIIATDAGREGELVARWIIEKSNVKKPIKRLWISSVTDKAIKDGFNNLKDGKSYENLYEAAQGRAEADWVVGINATRALTVKYNSQLSCGRVQTPTLALIAKREEEIKNFKPRDYYGIVASTKDVNLTWQHGKNNETRTFDKSLVEKTIPSIKNKSCNVVDVEKSLKKTYSPRLYDLTELQRDANKFFGFSAKETLSLMQRLYETYKVLTYPRTDSRYLTDDIVPTLKDRLKAVNVGSYSKYVSMLLKTEIKGNKSFVDNSKVTDHHAIIPTEQKVILSDLSNNERKIFDLVVKRFLAVLYPPFEYEQTTIKARIGDENFIARGKRVIKEGYREIYSNDDEDDKQDDIKEQNLPLINKGDVLNVISIKETSGRTTPPPYFNEGTLLSAMENPAKYMENKDSELSKILKDTGGIGTVATRADIIEKLFKTFLIENRGKDIAITGKGKQLLELVPEDLKSPYLTAEWEKKLNLISQGKLSRKSFLDETRKYTKEIIHEIKTMEETFRHDNVTRTKCPECGKFMLEVKGKKGKMLVCQDRECGHRKTISKTTNARCPNCHKKLELKGEGDGQIFVCSCGHREKLSTFEERRKKEKNKVDKKDVAKFMKDQKKEAETLNTDLADALSKLKLK